MAKKNGKEPTQQTPAGAEIPIPSREDVFRDLSKVAKPRKRPDAEDSADVGEGRPKGE